MTLFSVGQVWADTKTEGFETKDASTTYNSTVTVSSAESDCGIGWTIFYGTVSTNDKISGSKSAQMRYYSSSDNRGYVQSTTAIDGLSHVAFKARVSSTNIKMTVSYSADASSWTALATNVTFTETGKGIAFDYDVPSGGKYIKIEIGDGSTKPSSGNIKFIVDDVVFTYEAGGDDPTPVAVTGVTLDQSVAEVAVGKTITLVPTVAPSNATTKTVTWESDDDAIATVADGVVTGVAEGTATITVKTTDGNKTATCEVTVTAAPAAVNYEKVTAEPEDWSGEYLLVYEANATTARVWKGEDQANNYAEATISAGVIAAPEGAAVLTIAKVAESDPVVYTIMVGDKYIGQTSDANGIKIQTTAINNSISYNGTDAAVDIVASSAHLRYNSASSSYFRYYKSATYSSQKKIQLYKKADGKQNTGLAYGAADQKKLVKLGDAFTAPTLANPNNLTGITYASSDATVVEVNSSTGAIVEIKKAGVVVITASRAEDDTYKAGSASYTIGVTTHAGTEADPYVAADAKIAIDAMGTVENAYATGIVSNVVTTELPSEGYISFYFSADGTTNGQQIEAYKCYGLNSAPFEAVSDVVTGATVVVTGNLKKYNSTYEFDQNCHLVSYQAPAVPKQSIANTKATAYSVADAIGYAADGVTYDLNDYVYVRGVVYDVKSFDNGVMNIFIKDADAENQFELYKCAGINDGSSTTSFEALTDVKVGDIVIGYGQLTVYNNMSELKQGNYLADLKHVYTVRFWNTADGWGETINAHVWNTNGNVTEWPGVATTFAAGWNEMKVEQGNSLLFCTSDGSAQTADIDNIQADVCYVLTGEADDKGHLVVATTDDCDDRFYIAGDEALTGDNWNTTADRLVNGSITFTNIAANTYKFKITNGTWKWNIGGAKVDAGACSGVTIKDTDDYGNAVFSIDGAKDITITYNKATDKIVVTAVDYVAPVEPEYRAIVVAYGGKYYAMTKTLDNKGFTPLEVTIDGEGNVVVNTEAEKTSILWKYTEGNGNAMFQDADDKYLAHTGTGTDLMLQAADTENPEVWTWDNDNSCYYVAVTKDNKTTNRSFFYQETANKFKNYGVESNLGQNGYSGAPTFYAADKVIVSTTAKLRFFAPVEWEDDVYAFTWAEDYSGNHQMTAVEEGSRWFECDLKKGVEFLVRKGNGDIWTGQTVNIPALEADKCYAWAPKDGDGKFTVATIASCEMNYFIAGDEALTGVAEWGHATLVNNTVTYNQVPAAEEYKFKITNGTWDWNIGAAYVDADACEGVTILATDDNGNVVFSLASESNVTITYNPATEKISIVASTATPKEYYTKVTSTDDITAGYYLIVSEDYNVAYNGAMTDLNNTGNSIEVTIDNSKIEVSDQTDAAAFFIDPELGTIKSASGKYIGSYRASNEVAISDKIYKYPHESMTIDEGNAVLYAGTFGNNDNVMTLRYNTSNDVFRYYKDYGQKPIQLYKKAEVAKANPQLAFDQTAVEAIKDEAFTAPALSNNHNVTVSYESSATGKATVDETTGEVTIKNAGEVTIYAVSAGNDEYRESYAKYTITISAYETVRSGLEPGRYYTVCYDKTMKEIRGASLWSFNGKDANMAYIVEENLASYPAGTPYLIYAESDKLEAITEAVDNPEATNNNGLYGTLTEMSNTDLLAAGATHLLINGDAGSELRPLGSGYLKEKRAYVILGEIPNTTPTSSNAPGKRVRAIPMHQDAATGIDELNASEKPVKMVIDGQLYILRGEKMYDATGRLVK